MNTNYRAYARAKRSDISKSEFDRRVNAILNARPCGVPEANDHSADWFMAYVEERNRADRAEARLAAIEAEIAAGQLVDVRTLPKNVSYTFTRQTW